MTKHLKDMTLDELQAGYEKGKVTDEEIEQHKQWLKEREETYDPDEYNFPFGDHRDFW